MPAIKRATLMPFQDPNNFNLLTYVWMIIIAFWGGLVNYLSRVKRGSVSHFSFVELVSELVVSGFSGVITYWLCQATSLDPLYTAACVGIAGHAGGRMIFFIEQLMMKRLERLSKKLQD